MVIEKGVIADKEYGFACERSRKTKSTLCGTDKEKIA